MHIYVVAAWLIPCVLAGPWFDIFQAKSVEMEQHDEKYQLFEEFTRKYNKQYQDDHEQNVRKAIFAANLEFIQAHNRRYDSGMTSFYLGINQFTDMTNEEYGRYNGFDTEHANRTWGKTVLLPSDPQLPDTVDWRTKGYVTPVKDQKKCGSCWAFSATGSLEGQHFKQAKKLVSLSEQQLVDCSGSFRNHGCKGGLMDNAFKYTESVAGLESESDYPYTAKEGNCRFQSAKAVAKCTGYHDVVPRGSEQQLQNTVAMTGPISVGIDASLTSFQHYAGGVYDDPECNGRLDHGVLAVGYGTSPNGKAYWLVKNSWGKVWGDSGYIKMSRNKNNQCGIASSASYPTV